MFEMKMFPHIGLFRHIQGLTIKQAIRPQLMWKNIPLYLMPQGPLSGSPPHTKQFLQLNPPPRASSSFFFSASKLKVTFKCPKSISNKFKEQRCQLTISVGGKEHEGEELEKTIQLMERSFKDAVIMIDDSLQANTLAIHEIAHKLAQGIPQELITITIQEKIQQGDYLQQAIEDGTNWLLRNEKYISALSIPTQIVRWKDLIADEDFTLTSEKINTAYHENAAFKAAVDKSSSEFLARIAKRYGVNLDDNAMGNTDGETKENACRFK